MRQRPNSRSSGRHTPTAECEDTECDWKYSGANATAMAAYHNAKMGHRVYVETRLFTIFHSFPKETHAAQAD